MDRKQQVKKAVVSYRQRMKLKLIEYKGGKCKRCGYDKPVSAAYTFHHRDPTQKLFSVSGKSLKFDKLKKEVDKCDLLCCNCHAEVHDAEHENQRNKNILDFDAYQKSLLGEISCQRCNKKFTPRSRRRKYCSEECSRKNSRRCKHPSKNKLSSLIKEHSWSYIGRKFHVSDNAVRKWARKYDLI